MMIPRQQYGPRRVAGLVLTAGAVALAAALFGQATVARAADDAKEPTAEQVEMFEKKIRPVLVEKCYSCHSHQAKKVKGEYYLDSRDAMRKGGESKEAAIVPGEPDKSPLIKAIKRSDPDSAMPPKDKDALSKEQIKDFEDWVKAGAPDPRNEADKSAPGKPSASASDAKNPASAQSHWAFQKPVEPVVPSVKNARWVRSPVDAFVLARLESKGLTPAPQADKHTLIRRAYFDLIGLPPSAEEVAAFEADQSADAFAKVVDHLLASPRYGERWGRYWLDVARYADTKGYVFEAERKFPYSYTYRDYVIRAFNEDLPYDQFIIQQIAADKLHLGADKRPLAAMGFLTLGRRFLENQADIIDDRIDVVTRGTMALTVQCARCHDHKYDPIPTADYYSLYGIFASSVEPQTLPVIGGSSEQTSASLAFEKELKTREAAAETFLAEKSAAALKGLRSAKVVADCLIASQAPDAVPETLDLNKKLVAGWVKFLAPSKSGHDPIFAPWNTYAAIPAAEFAAKAPAVTEQLFAKPDDAKPIHPLVAELFRDKPPTSLREVADRYGKLLADNSSEAAHADADKEALRMVLHGIYSPLFAKGDNRVRFLRRDDRTGYNNLKKKVDELKANDPGAPPAAMVLNDSPTPNDTPIFKRGNPGLPGEVVPRRFLACVSTAERKPFRDGSGRLELAKAIASKDNPLTARVMVNRVWMEHFGAGLVRTPSDFGVRSDPPANPELLDYLAVRFMNDGWSIKKLHRQILLSSTWQQASDHPQAAQYANVDAENTLLWKQNRRRMDFEAMRDSLLKVAGALDETAGGRAVDITDAANNRRTVYGFIDRQNLPGIFRTFDFASPDTHSPRRFFTTVPQQALFMINSAFIERASRQLVARKDVAADAEATNRVGKLYQTLFGRSPSAEETSEGVAFVSGEQMQTVVGATPWRYGYGRYDAASDRVVEFKPLTTFTAGRWELPASDVSANPKLKWTSLTATGGHPGQDDACAVIRRWVAPADGTAVVSGTVSHQLQNSDGVLARVVASGIGQVTSVAVQRMDVTTNITGVNVKKGDTIDFVVESRATTDFDSFTWSPNVKLTRPNATVAGGVGVIESDAQRDFAGMSSTAMSPWEKYAQVLLLSNEFAFVD